MASSKSTVRVSGSGGSGVIVWPVTTSKTRNNETVNIAAYLVDLSDLEHMRIWWQRMREYA